jgi:hypothetical protein
VWKNKGAAESVRRLFFCARLVTDNMSALYLLTNYFSNMIVTNEKWIAINGSIE